MTLKNLAELCGTSVSTVSKVFLGNPEISESTRRKVTEVAKELGCYEKYYKGPLERPVIALLFPETESEFYGREIDILEREIRKRGADTVVALTRFDPETEARLFSELVYRMKVDGVILSGVGHLIKNPDQIPLVTFYSYDAKLSDLNSDIFAVDFKSGIDQAVALIKSYGHKKIGFIGDKYTSKKMELLQSSLRAHGLPVYKNMMVKASSRFAKAGEEGLKKILEGTEKPDVIVSAYDRIAFGAIRAAIDLGIDVPGEISFVGMDDISANDYIEVPLTSIHIHMEDVSKNMVDLLFKRIENRHYRESREIIIPSSVILRKSLCDKNSKNS